MQPNRSLTAKGRIVWLMLIASAALVTGGGAVALGAWPVLPFAGLEVALIWLAFRVIASHDHDYEVLRVVDQQFEWECRTGDHVQRLRGNAAWANVQVMRKRQHCQVRLRYGGECVPLGRFITDQRRENLLAQIGRFFPAAT